MYLEHEGTKTEECVVDYDPSSNVVVLLSGKRKGVTKGALFTLYAEVFDQDSEEYGTYNHIQSIFAPRDIPANVNFEEFKMQQQS